MKKQFILGLLIGIFLVIPALLFAQPNLASKLAGRILLQVENKGEAWYINPVTNTRFFLGRPENAFEIMRKQGLGITNSNLDKIEIDKGSVNPQTIVYAENKEGEYKAEIEKLKKELANYKLSNSNLINNTVSTNEDYNILLKKYNDLDNWADQYVADVKIYTTNANALITDLHTWWYEAINKSCSSSYTYDYTKELKELEMRNYLKSISDSLNNISWQMSW